MRLPFGLQITRRSPDQAAPARRAFPPQLSGTAGWWPIWPLVREPYTGAWQRNDPLVTESIISYFAVFACVTLIAGDIGKMNLRLLRRTPDDIWEETESAAFGPVLRRPNPYQNRIKFVEWWVISKLLWGNTYALKVRDDRNVVRQLHLLDPSRTRPLVAPDGSVFYEIAQDALAQVDVAKIVPAREIIHDLMIPLYHPLVGVTPLYACGKAAQQGLAIQSNSTDFFANGSNPGGVISGPTDISIETAERVKRYWDTEFSGNNAGKVAILGSGMKYEPMTVNANDAQLIEQFKWTAEVICSVYHVPPHKIGVGPMPTYTNIEALDRQYYSQCLQEIIESLEAALDYGLELPSPYGTEFDRDDLISMDTATMMESATKGVSGAVLTVNEARRKFSKKPVKGGDTVYMQQQQFALEALARRDEQQPAPTSTKPSAPPPANADGQAQEPPPQAPPAKHVPALSWREAWRQKVASYGLP